MKSRVVLSHSLLKSDIVKLVICRENVQSRHLHRLNNMPKQIFSKLLGPPPRSPLGYSIVPKLAYVLSDPVFPFPLETLLLRFYPLYSYQPAPCVWICRDIYQGCLVGGWAQILLSHLYPEGVSFGAILGIQLTYGIFENDLRATGVFCLLINTVQLAREDRVILYTWEEIRNIVCFALNSN